MTEILESKFNNFIKENISKPESMLVALSGGIDSMALAIIASNYCQKHNINFYSLHIDHNLHSGSGKIAQDLALYAKKMKLNLTIKKRDQGKDINSNIEAKAREARYKLLTEFARENKIGLVLTAHNQDEQVENFFIRLSRGSGIDGLAKMSEIQKIEDEIILARPFINVAKSQLEEFLKQNNYQFFEDPTNQDQKFLRNKIRKLLTEIEDKELIEQRIMRSMDSFSRAKDFLNNHCQQLFDKLVIINNENGQLKIKFLEFKNLDQEMALRILIKILNFHHLEKLKPRFNKLFDLYQKIINQEIKKKINFKHNFISIKDDYLVFVREA